MHIKTLMLVGLISSSVSSAYASTLPERVKWLEHATATCADKALDPGQTSGVLCEVSAVARVGDTLILANDKMLPGNSRSPIFTRALENNRIVDAIPEYLNAPVLKQAQQFEALTTTLDGRYVIASTAFSRVGTDSDAGFDNYNTIVYWPADAPGRVDIASLSVRQGVASSVALREQMSQALGAEFFQVEGLSVAPGNRLLVGIRKQGANRKEAREVFRILATTFSLDNGVLQFTSPFKLIFEFVPHHTQQVPQDLGLSSIEFDRYNQDRLYALTSFEDEENISGYLWSIPLRGLLEGDSLSPQLVRTEDGLPVKFVNKPEGLEVLDQAHLLIVHDDDRMQIDSSSCGIASGPNEFAYTVVGF
ncbi:hypothetical protein [Pseudomonas sp. UM16]|uniref:hypothetical protein n=1 Tax=Pseudomonas sp. UM16 TaxID=3158962 RepID=UPI00398FB351